MGKLDRTDPDRACTALNQDPASLDRTADVNSPMGSDAGNTKTSALLHRDAVRK